MRDRSLVEDAADEVYRQEDEEDDGEDATRPNATGLVRLDACAGVLRADLEEVGALVGRVDEGHGRVGADRVAVAEECEGGRLSPRLSLFPRGHARLPARVVVVDVMLEQLAATRRDVALVEVVDVRTGRAAAVLEDQLAAAGRQD